MSLNGKVNAIGRTSGQLWAFKRHIRMRVLDLFSGIGGFSLGLERAGMRTVAFCECDPYCCAVLAKHWPDVPIFTDIRELSAETLGITKGNGRGAGRAGDLIQQVRGNNSPSGHYKSMSSAGDSPARTSASPGRAQASKANAAAYGQSTPELLAKFDLDTSSWRTSQLCLDGGLTEFSETWPRSGLMRNGIAYQLPPLVRLTGETDSGLWHTPRAIYGEHSGMKSLTHLTGQALMWPTPDTINRKSAKAMTASTNNGRRSGGGQSSPPGLEQAVEMSLGIIPKELETIDQLPPKTRAMWPTPRAMDGQKGSRNLTPGGVRHVESGRGNLAEHVQMFPTPTARDYRPPGRSQFERTGSKAGECLPQQIGGALNPTWVEWLMGFPLGWTALEPSATQSFRRSRKSSAAPS